MKRNLITYFLVLVFASTIVYAKPREGAVTQRSTIIKVQSPLEANDIRSFIWNTGVLDQDLRTNNTPGLEWVKGTGKFAIFTAGLSLGALYEGSLRMANASYNGEYAPGTIENGVLINDSRFKIYNVKSTDNQFTNPDYANWGLMVPYGAPYVDVDNSGTFDVSIDKPGIKDAAQTIFVCLNDFDPSNHTPSEGFGGGTAPLSAEVRLTAWAYSSPGLESIQFVQWVVINKSPAVWNSTHFGIVCDPDLGDAEDDYIGCDIDLNMAFCYNADNTDGDGSGRTYGANPPASGMDYFISPIVPTGNQNDSVVIYHPPGSENRIVKRGFREIGLTSFVYFTNSSSPGPVCERDPSNAPEAYKYLQGIKKDGTPWIDNTTQQITKYCYPGDPETNNGWTEYKGRIENCNGLLTGTVTTPTPPGDRRYIFNSGDANFTMNPNDTQYIVLAQMVARGSNNKNSVTLLKNLSRVAQQVYDSNFKVIPPPAPPQVNISTLPNSSLGTVDVTLSWGDTSEYYYYEDRLFNSGTYTFQGYEIYEIRRDLANLPDLMSPNSDKSGISLIAIYDKKDGVGIVMDSLKLGISVNGVEQYGYFPVTPPYPLPITPGFPNTGLSRRITISTTKFTSVNGGSERFIYGNTYKFAVVAYGVNPDSTALRGGKLIRNSLSAQVITYVPEAPVLGSQFIFKNGDTLNTNRRDLGLMPIVVDQEKVLSAKYRIQYGNSDTMYSIYRSLDNGVSFGLIKDSLKFANYDAANNTVADDSSRVYDGILFKVQKIRFRSESPSGNYIGNVGVIQDPILPRDSIQTRYYGWQYVGNNPYDSSVYKPTGRPWQSRSMNISYPTRNTYVGFRSLLNPEDLRQVKIVFTGYGNGQQAYRYLANTTNPPSQYTYQDMREVPFKVYEIDPFDGSSTERQVNCGFLEFPNGSPDNKWEPTADSLGGKEVLYIFRSDYDPNPVPPYTTANLLIQQSTVDVMYVWAPRLKTSGTSFSVGDQFIIYPYTVTRPEVTAGNALYYDVDTRAPIIGSTQVASERNGLQEVKVVPNPYYGFNSLESSTSGRFVTFRNLPTEITIKIYSLNGDLIRTLTKKDNNSTMRWNMNNQDDVPIASGIYIALLDAPGIGTRSLKIAVFTPEERTDF
jgi:hypothetical protein